MDFIVLYQPCNSHAKNAGIVQQRLIYIISTIASGKSPGLRPRERPEGMVCVLEKPALEGEAERG